MAGTDATDLQALLSEFLDACVDALDTIPGFDPGLGGAPDRRFISPGQSADDCCPDQLTVYALQVNGQEVGPEHSYGRYNMPVIQARIVRCIPTEAEAPDPDERTEIAAQVNADGWALWNSIFNAIRSGDLFTLCGPVIWDGLRSVQPSGLCGGWTLTLRVRLEGYS